MRRLILGLLFLALASPVRVAAQTGTGIRIDAPASGGILRGVVNITGTSAVDGFFASELSFAYASDTTNTWFLIFSTDQPVADGLLAAWDTNLLTDGDYVLRLRVTLQDGTVLETLVTGLRVRNLSPTETATLVLTSTPAETSVPSPLYPTPMTLPTATPRESPIPTLRPTPTPLPPNPASVTSAQITFFLARGLIITLFTFLVIALFLRLRKN